MWTASHFFGGNFLIVSSQFEAREMPNMIFITRRALPLILLSTSLAFPCHAVAQDFKESFPRIGAYEIGSAFNVTNPDYRQTLAKNDILILGMWRRYSKPDDVTGVQLSVGDVATDIRRRAEAMGNGGIHIAKYSAINESSDNPGNGASGEKWDKLHNEIGPGYPVNNDWWARTKDGEHTSSWEGQWHTNLTEYVQRDQNGDTYPEWTVEENYNVFFKDIPAFDMWFFDNWFYRPRVDAGIRSQFAGISERDT